MMDLSAESKRLRRALAVAEKWIEAASEGEETGHLAASAECMRDQLEERLARTAWRMHALDRRRELREMGTEDPEGAASAAVPSDALLGVYRASREVPDEEFGGGPPERERYARMGALLVAREAADAETGRLAGRRPARTRGAADGRKDAKGARVGRPGEHRHGARAAAGAEGARAGRSPRGGPGRERALRARRRGVGGAWGSGLSGPGFSVRPLLLEGRS
jgi:hypothetical protein